MRMMIAALLVCMALPAFAATHEERALREWAFMQCLARAYDAPDLRKDALAIAEDGPQVDAELHEAIERLMLLYLTQEDSAQPPLQRCVALREGEALGALIREHGRLRIGRNDRIGPDSWHFSYI